MGTRLSLFAFLMGGSALCCVPCVKLSAFAVPRYQYLPEAEWPNVENWFKVQIDRVRQRKKKP